jgi:hypothetical protein
VKNKRDEQGKREHADDNVFDHRAEGNADPTFPHREKRKSLPAAISTPLSSVVTTAMAAMTA